MRCFLRFIVTGNRCHHFLQFNLLHNNLRLSNMFSTRSQFLGIGLNITKSLQRSPVSRTAATRKLTCSYFSLKVDVGGELQPAGDVTPEKKKPVHRGISVDMKIPKYRHTNWLNRYESDHGVALVLKLKAMSKSTFRDPSAVQDICSQLCDKDLKLNIRDYVDILYSLSVLNVHNEELLMKVLNHITDLLNEIYKSSPFISSISYSMRNLLIRHVNALNGMINWFSSRHSNLDMSDAADLIQTLAVLNYFPASADILLQQTLNSDMVEYSSSIKYLNFVWALTIIDRVQPEIAESVMSSSFRKKLDSILAPGPRRGAYLKLVNIHAHANARKFKINMDSQWYSREISCLKDLKEKRRKDPIIINLIDCLATFLPVRTFNTFVEIPSGYVIDVVCFFDTNHNPITELEFVKGKDGIKLAILVLSYKDLCSPEKSIANGIIEFHKRCMVSSDYRVLYITFNEFPARDNLRKKSAYLKQKIEAALPKNGVTG